MTALKTKEDLARHIHLKKTTEKAEQLVSELMELNNVMGNDIRNAVIQGMTAAMCKQHRFIQQEFMTSLQETLDWYGKTGTDARNIAGVAWAKQAGALQVDVPFMS